jgi:hypothetical protein
MAIKNALAIKEKSGCNCLLTQISHIRFQEKFTKEARMAGVIFIRYREEPASRI